MNTGDGKNKKKCLETKCLQAQRFGRFNFRPFTFDA